MKTDSGQWIFIYVLCYAVKETSAVYCGYQTSTGVTQHTFCMETCCEGSNITFENVCCRYQYDHLYISAVVAGTLLVSSSAVCLVCICCKKKCFVRPRSTLSPSTATDQLPTVSAHIQPFQSLTYQNPPPYCLEEPGTDEQRFSIPKDPPPPYSLYDTAS